MFLKRYEFDKRTFCQIRYSNERIKITKIQVSLQAPQGLYPGGRVLVLEKISRYFLIPKLGPEIPK